MEEYSCNSEVTLVRNEMNPRHGSTAASKTFLKITTNASLVREFVLEDLDGIFREATSPLHMFQ